MKIYKVLQKDISEQKKQVYAYNVTLLVVTVCIVFFPQMH